MREKQRAKRAPGTLIRSLRGGLPGYTIVEGSEENTEDIQKLMAGNEEYFRLVKEKLPTLEGARESYTILPPNTSREQKIFAVFYKKGKCTAVLDFIQGYPKESVGFIGLFMLAADCQGKGIGKKMFRHIREAAEKAGLEKLRLGCYAANEPSRIFWEKTGLSACRNPEKRRTETAGAGTCIKKQKYCFTLTEKPVTIPSLTVGKIKNGYKPVNIQGFAVLFEF